MVYCLRNHHFGCRHQSKSSRTDKHFNLLIIDSNYTYVEFAVAASEIIAAIVDLRVEQQLPIEPLNQYFLSFHM